MVLLKRVSLRVLPDTALFQQLKTDELRNPKVTKSQLAMKEILRVLKNDGILIATVPYSTILNETVEDKEVMDSESREKKFGQKDHVRIYSKEDFIRRLMDSGFYVKPLNLSDLFGEYFSRKFALIRDEQIFICSKTLNNIK